MRERRAQEPPIPKGPVHFGCQDESECLFENDPVFRTTLKSLLPDRFKIPATLKIMRHAKAREMIRKKCGGLPTSGRKILDNPHVSILDFLEAAAIKPSKQRPEAPENRELGITPSEKCTHVYTQDGRPAGRQLHSSHTRLALRGASVPWVQGGLPALL